MLTYDRWGIIASKESIWKQEGGGQRVRVALNVAVPLCTGDSKKKKKGKKEKGKGYNI